MSCSPAIRRLAQRRRFAPAWPCALLLLGGLAAAARANGLVFTVNTAADLPDASLGDHIADADLSTPGAQVTLRAAVMQANAEFGPDTIMIPAGIWKLTLAGTDDAKLGDLDVTDDLTIIGVAADPQTGEAGTIIDAKKLKDRVFDVVSGRTLTLQGLTLRNGRALGTGQSGGAIRVAGSASLTQVILSGCKSGLGGGAIDVTSNLSSLTLQDVLFEKDTATGDGGGLSIEGGLLDAERVTWQSCKSTKGHGGGLALTAGFGMLKNVTFSSNSAKLDGGAIEVLSLQNLQGGDGTPGVLSITSSTLGDNVCKATSGIGSDDSFATNNVLLRDTLLDNKGKRNWGPGAPPSSLGGNLDSGSTCALPDDELSNTDPLLLKLKNYGGFTPTRALKTGSPAIDHGVDSGAPTTDQRGMPRVDIPDLGGLSSYDCGAFEFEEPAQP